ncbi:hypothetical protein [Sphingomonas sp. SUN039]|uniref:beta strand repeat-containing protein n=1 Tax=Sphingomonas sp. SUN039 TaxID=2937787 RepID=UPI0021647A90|nr:hypothetical protein [Sphingomonas sp. SUN039]UVO53384.1 hypothetical protein M0209_04330 [Sphingomonas sp. SUN039]
MIASPLRCRLLATCAFGLLAAPVFGQTYADRALQGDATFNPAEVVIARTPVKDTITVRTPQAIINWNPETGPGVLPPSPLPINFLPSGREALFDGAPGLTDYVVLNRILPSTNRPISFNGTVTSQVTPVAGLPAQRGGSVWFYSPGGIIAGPTSIFNVGNLILTANDIDATGGLFSGTGAIRFRGASNSTSAVTIQPGAQINLTRAGSYFGVVAPQVTMGGTATVNGSTAYAAAEQVDLELNGGFFNISFLTGTGVANALTHTGTTTGPAGNGTIAMAAMPKNTAITMLVGGTVGYTPAATATVQNGTIVLSAGQNVVFGNIGGNSSTTAANLNIGSGLFRSEVNAQATNIVAAPAGGAPLTFTSNVSLASAVSTQVRIDAGQTMTVGGNLLMGSGQPGQGGATGITVNDGTLTVAGQTFLNATAFGKDDPVGTGGNATGGQSSIAINGGTVTFGDTLSLSADGVGGGGPILSGNGIGGTASITLNAGTTPTVLNLNGFGNQLSATGSVGGQFPSIGGGNATGGNALLTINSGTMNSTELTLDASATGGDATTGLAGVASAGTARVLVTGGRYNTDSLFLASRERQAGASTGGTAGATAGSGLAAVDVSGAGILSVGANGGNGMSIDADAVKAGPRVGVPAAGGAVIAGTARLTATNGGTITTDATAPSAPKPPVLVTASVVFLDTVLGAPTSSQRAGTVLVNADGGTMTLHRLDMRAHALARDFNIPNDRAGASFGGTATLAARNGGSITVVTGAGVTPISAYGTGGSTNTPALGTGGTVDVLALGGTLVLPDGLSVDARGFSGTTLGGTGGTINVRSTTGAALQAGSLTAGVTTLDASGQISAGLPNATAGAITVANIGAGQTLTFANLFARAGVSGSGAASGSITLTADNAPIVTTANTTGIDLGTLGTLTLSAAGAAGGIVGSTGVFGYGNDILVGHTGVAPGTASTVTGPSVQLQAGRDQIHTGSVTLRGGTVRLVGQRTLGGVDSSVISTGGIELGSGLLATTNSVRFRTLDTTGLLRGYQGASSYTPEITTTGTFIVGERAFAGAGNIDIRANAGVDIADAGTSATGQVLLSSTAGDVRLGTSGIALATRPNGITLTAPAGTVRFTNLFSRAAITTSGLAIAGGDANAATNLLLNGTGGTTVFGTVVAGGALAAAGTKITGTSATATTGTLSLVGPTGITVPTVVAGGAIGLVATNGAVTVASNLQPGGTATATGQSIFLRSLGALTFSNLNATAGNLDVATVGALSVTTPQATGSVSLASSGGNVAFGTATAGTSFTVDAAGTATGTSATGTAGPVSISGTTGVTIPTIVSGGTTALTAANGAITVATNLQSAGLVTASARSAFIRSTGALAFGALTATAGNLDVSTAGALSLVTPQASGSITLASTGGNVALGAATAGTSLAVTSPGTIAGTSATATTGPLTLNGATGVMMPTVVSGGTVSLSAVNGAVTVATNLQPGGTALATGQSIFLRSLGALSFNTLSATAGNLDVSSVGALTIATPQATGSVALASTGGNVAFGTATAGTSFTVNAAGAATGTSATATNGPVSITGATGITVPTIVSGGTTTLSAANGAISVATNLQSAGLFTASGRSLFLRSTGALTGGVLTATAGDVDVAAGTGLTAATVQSSGDVILGAGTVLTPGAVTAGRDIVLTAQSLQAGALTAPRDLRIVTTGMAMATGTIAATRDLTIDAGQTNLQAVNGGSVAITSGQGVIFNTINSASTVALNAGDDAVGTSVVATGAVTTTAGRNLNFGTLQAGGNATLTAAGSLALGTVTARNLIANATGNLTTGSVTAVEDIRLFGGPGPAVMTTGNMTAGDDIIATGNAITTGNLLTTGLGPDNEDDGSTINLQLNRIATGTANSAGTILYAASQPITFTSTTSRFGTVIRSSGPITGGNSTAGTTLDIQGGSINTANGQAGGALNYINFDPTDTIRTGTLTGATVTASSRGTLATGAVNAPGAVNLLGDLGLTVASATSTGGDLQLIAQTSGSISSGALRAGGNLNVSGQAGNDVLTTLDAGGRILIGAGGGTLTFTRATAGGLVGVSAGGNIGFGTVTAGGTFQMQTPRAITGTLVTSASGAPNIVQGDTGITLPTLATNGVTVLSAVNGAISVGTDLRSTGAVTATGRSVSIRSTGALAFDQLTATAGNADVTTAGALTVGPATASGALTLASGGVATVNGVATGATVAVASPDIVIGANGRLGTLGTTTQLTLTNNSTQNRTFIGGTGGSGYSLSAAETGRLFANNIAIVAPVIGTASTAFNSTRTPDVVIDAFTFGANTNLGAQGTFSISNGGKVRMIGAVGFTGVGSGQTFAIRGDEAIEVLDAGRIALGGTAGLAGTLDLTSRNIVASSSAALADFGAASTLSAISDRAGKNDGAVDDGGYLQAGGIRATLLNSTLIIQNTGAATTAANRDYSGRRGYTVGTGGFTIVQGGSNPVRIAINGRQVGATTPLGAPTVGGFVTGLDDIPLIKIRSVDAQASDIFQVPASGVLTAEQLAAAPRLFDTTSTVNGCTITGGSGCRVVPNDPIRDILLGDFGEGSVGNLLPLALIQLKDYVTPGDEPLIDEPVTGAGNDDLWSVDDTKPKCDPAKEKCPA